jgi:hypothetical protein
MAKKKQPKIKAIPNTEKKPKVASSPTSFHGMRPSWRISIIEMVEPYGWHTINANKIVGIKDKLANFEKMTWAEILIDGKKFHHTVAVSSLSSIAQARLREINLDDIDEIVSIRLSGKERIWGILDQGVLNVLWWDPEHQIYPYEKKNT